MPSLGKCLYRGLIPALEHKGTPLTSYLIFQDTQHVGSLTAVILYRLYFSNPQELSSPQQIGLVELAC